MWFCPPQKKETTSHSTAITDMIRYDMSQPQPSPNPTNLPPILTQPAPAPHLTHHGRITTCLRGQQSPNLGRGQGMNFPPILKPYENLQKMLENAPILGETKEIHRFGSLKVGKIM